MKNACLCFSGKKYAECCRPFHSGAELAPTAEALMRSRYAAFALGEGQYLVDTLAKSHADHADPNLAQNLARVKHEARYMGLLILHASVDEVLFFARIFMRGVDRSFVELSHFVQEDGRLRYASGILAPRNEFSIDPKDLTREAFLVHTQKGR